MPSPATIIKQNLPTVALVGRVNVGKSTLFNKMIEQDKALVSSIPGTTRTRNIGVVNWRGKNFRLVDTGGLTFSDDVPLEQEIIKQTEMALKEADLIIFLLDVKTGILPQERELGRRLIKHKHKIIFAANKADSRKWLEQATDKEFLKLGLGEPYPISAVTGANVGELLEIISRRLNKLHHRPKKIEEIQAIKVALLGKPNVGKSTLFNALIGREEVIVSDLPHTTREPYDTLVEFDRQPLLFMDTAGIRKKAKVTGELEIAGIQKSIMAIKKSDVTLLLLVADEPISSQDQQLGGLLKESSRSVIIVINKWDMADDNSDQFRRQVKHLVYNAFPHLDFAPIVFVSAKTKYRVQQIFPLIIQAYQGRNIKITGDSLAKFLQETTKHHRPARGKGTRQPKILGLKQVKTNPPIFEMTIKAKTSVHLSYVHYITNCLHKKFGFFATPIVIKLTKRKK